MPFPEDFLTSIANEKKLTDRQKEVFLRLFGEDTNKVQIAGELGTTESVVSTRLTEIYQKFGITDSGPVKERELRRKLEGELRKSQRLNAGSQPSDQGTGLLRNEC